jgi:hypothetical protein
MPKPSPVSADSLDGGSGGPHGKSVGVTVSYFRCAAHVRRADLMHSDWRCDNCGEVPSFHVTDHIGPEIVAVCCAGPAPTVEHMPLWWPWSLPAGWTVTWVGWAGDQRSGVRATALACSGPNPLVSGPADVVLIAE